MSRCFPFPPPGYEKASRDDADLLKKEKDREKKHKKEKKNRERREGKDKEKREKVRSDGKHRDKKEKKDKHRDKKERDRDKDKISASDEKIFPGQSDPNKGLKAPDEKKFSGRCEVNSGETFIQRGKEIDLDRKSISGEKKFSGKFSSYSEKVSQNSHLPDQPKESTIVQEVDRRTRDEARGNGKQLVEKIISMDARKDEQMVRLVAKATGTFDDIKENIKRGDDRKLDGQGTRDKSRISGKAMAPSLPGIVQTIIDKTQMRGEKDIEKRIERKEKSKQKEGDNRRSDKRKGKGKEGQAKEKEKKKEEKAKEKNEHKNPELDKLKENNKADHIHNAKASHLLKENTKSGVTEENLRKRKDSDTNGFFDAIDVRPSKMPRSTSSQSLMENGKIWGTSLTSITCSSDGHSVVNDLKVGAKECRINGLMEDHALSISSTTQPLSIPIAKSLPTVAQADQTAKVFKKLAHPDTKHLSEVYTVPKMEEWYDFDDQDWLFQGRDYQLKKPKVGSFGVDETTQVWSEALQIEAADICALPYVIPY